MAGLGASLHPGSVYRCLLKSSLVGEKRLMACTGWNFASPKSEVSSCMRGLTVSLEENMQSTQTSCRIGLLCLFLSVQHNHTSSMEHLLFHNFQGPHQCFWRVPLKRMPTIPGKVWYVTSLDKPQQKIYPLKRRELYGILLYLDSLTCYECIGEAPGNLNVRTTKGIPHPN